MSKTTKMFAVFYKTDSAYGWEFWGWARNEAERDAEYEHLRKSGKQYFSQEMEVPE